MSIYGNTKNKMGKVKVYSIDSKERYRINGELFEIIASLKNKREVIDFLFGLITPSETLMVSRRIQVAKMILGENNFQEIRRKLKVSNQTINKVEHWLRSDEEKNKLILEKIKQIKRPNNFNSTKNFSSSRLDRYAHHRLFKKIVS